MKHWIHKYCGTKYTGPIQGINRPPNCPACKKGDETIYEDHDFYETEAGQEILNGINLHINNKPFDNRDDIMDLYSELAKEKYIERKEHGYATN
ncbi:MAG: hypothetical protein E2O29_01700 [Deltaproteobacteria bacterium]|nr:MAG: hypothetical protein E2O29_01700 [Deltaproteobacteria bacterium]